VPRGGRPGDGSVATEASSFSGVKQLFR
jgi:hypothetical protein